MNWSQGSECAVNLCYSEQLCLKPSHLQTGHNFFEKHKRAFNLLLYTLACILQSTEAVNNLNILKSSVIEVTNEQAIKDSHQLFSRDRMKSLLLFVCFLMFKLF